MKKEIVKIENLSKTFKVSKSVGLKELFKRNNFTAIEALKNINLSIKEGEFTALLGPNGAGKSTLIKILIGVLAYDQGQIKVLDYEPLNDRLKIIDKLGIVFGQRSRMWYDLPVKESFELTKRLYIDDYPKNKNGKLSEWENYLIDSIDIRHLLDRQVKKLSLGEKMRCELVNTLLYNPDLIFLDEPTIGLDVVSKQKIREALKILNENGKTILLTSHDTGDIEKLCKRVVIINHGEVVVDLDIDSFMKLNDESQIFIKSKSKISKKDFKKNNLIKNINFISEYEVKVSCEKIYLKDVIKYLFENLDIADIKFESEGVEKILFDIYKKEE